MHAHKLGFGPSVNMLFRYIMSGLFIDLLSTFQTCPKNKRPAIFISQTYIVRCSSIGISYVVLVDKELIIAVF